MEQDTISTRWLTVAEAAQYMRCTERTIRRWIADGLISQYKITGIQSVRIKLADLESMFELDK